MSLPQMMQAMGREYVQPTNKIQGRTGTLWEGRYKASPVQDDEYLLTCYRYIELNPVRAGIVIEPIESCSTINSPMMSCVEFDRLPMRAA